MKVIDKLACPIDYECQNCINFKDSIVNTGWMCDKSHNVSHYMDWLHYRRVIGYKYLKPSKNLKIAKHRVYLYYECCVDYQNI